MSIQVGLFNILKTIPEISTRVYPLIVPQNPTYPLIVYQRISSFDTGTIEGKESLDMGRFQIKIYSKTYKESLDNIERVKTVLSGKGHKLLQMEDYENDTLLFVQILDYQLSDDVI